MYFLLFILLTLFIIIICLKKMQNNNSNPNTLQSNNTLQENFEEPPPPLVNQLIDTTKIKQESINKLMLITKLDIVAQNQYTPFPDKHLLIEGTKLEKVEDVYFGDLKGIILENKVINNIHQIRVLPPNFTKYTRMLESQEFENIEIKLKIDDPVDDTSRELKFNPIDNTLTLTTDVIYTSDSAATDGLNNGTFEIVTTPALPKLQLDTTTNKKAKLTFKVAVVKQAGKTLEDGNMNIKINNTEYLISLDFLSDIAQTKTHHTHNEIYTLFVDASNFDDIKYNIRTNKLFEETDGLTSVIIKEMKLEYLHDDINMLLPTGLFYRFNFVTSGTNPLDIDSNSWNIHLSDKLENPDILLSDDVKNFYEDITELTTEPPAPPDEIINFKVENVEVNNVENDDTILRITWTKPVAANNYRFAFIINVMPMSDNDSFMIKDEQISFEKEVFDFSTAKLTPGNNYKIQLSTYRTDKQEVIELSEIVEHKYRPPNFDEYHSHIFDPVTKEFKTELTKENPELLRTYYQLLAANKIKMAGEMSNAQQHINEEAKCVEGNLGQLQSTSSEDVFDDNLKDLLNKNADGESAVFRNKQSHQDVQMERVKEKISELESLQGKIKKVQNTNIKSITSVKDGTDLAVKKMSNGKFMVGLNDGCLAVNKQGKYNYVPCNIFDKKQFFDLDSIENVDEYNNLLLMNLNSKISPSVDVKYPFYTLKPNKSNKCVHLDNKEIKIKPCNDEETIRYTGHFSNKDCPKN
jgi:hypothetical protein